MATSRPDRALAQEWTDGRDSQSRQFPRTGASPAQARSAPARPRIVILGAGPAGLGAAWRLQEQNFDAWELFEADSHPGGLSASEVDPQGFVWDLGVHVLHSHYAYLDKVLDETLPDEWFERVRDARIWLRDRFVPYPLQHHLWQLPEEDQRLCIAGLREASQAAPDDRPANFAQWILARFGHGLAEVFLYPYNRKVWGCEPQEMGVDWVAERVASVAPAELLRKALRREDNSSWGPNARFRFPQRGGTGRIWNALFQRLAGQRTHFGKQAVRVCPGTRTVQFADGTTTTYDVLVSTLPLDCLLAILVDQPALAASATRLRHSALHVIGVALAGPAPAPFTALSWVYFPQEEVPFHRVTVLSNFAPQMVPEPGNQWSLLAELTEHQGESWAAAQVLEATLDGLHEAGFLEPGTRTLSLFHRRLEHAYPTPLMGLEDVLRQTLPALENLGIFSRGRFGAWKYEIGNMDHAFMQGVEVVDRILLDVPERTLSLHA